MQSAKELTLSTIYRLKLRAQSVEKKNKLLLLKRTNSLSRSIDSSKPENGEVDTRNTLTELEQAEVEKVDKTLSTIESTVTRLSSIYTVLHLYVRDKANI